MNPSLYQYKKLNCLNISFKIVKIQLSFVFWYCDIKNFKLSSVKVVYLLTKEIILINILVFTKYINLIGNIKYIIYFCIVIYFL